MRRACLRRRGARAVAWGFAGLAGVSRGATSGVADRRRQRGAGGFAADSADCARSVPRLRGAVPGAAGRRAGAQAVRPRDDRLDGGGARRIEQEPAHGGMDDALGADADAFDTARVDGGARRLRAGPTFRQLAQCVSIPGDRRDDDGALVGTRHGADRASSHRPASSPLRSTP